MGRGGNPCILRSFPKGGKFQMTHNYYIKNETVKCSEEKIGEKLCDLELKKEILDMTTKA